MDNDGEIKIGRRNNASDQERLQHIHDYSVESGAVCATPEPEQSIIPILSLDDTLISTGDAIKSLGNDKFGGYLVRFSTANDPDISEQRDYFTPQTDFDTEFPSHASVYFNHGMDKKMGKRKLGNADMRLDEVGVWAETILQERDEYEKKLKEFALAGKLGWSSGTASHLVERKNTGETNEIIRWPLGLDASITHIPAEPRNQIMELKSVKLEDLETEIENIETNGGNTMEYTNEQIDALVERASKAAATEALKSLPAIQSVNVAVTKDAADQPWENGGKFLQAVKNATLWPQNEDVRLRPLKGDGMKAAAGANEAVPSQGGYLVSPQFAPGIVTNMLETGKILTLCDNMNISGNSMTWKRAVDASHASGSLFGGVTTYWLGEGASITVSKAAYEEVTLKLKKLAAICPATDELLADDTALESWLMTNVPKALIFEVEEQLINGIGVGQPLGVLQGPNLNTILRETAAYVSAVDVANMWSRRWTGASNYVWLVNPTVLGQIYSLTFTGTYFPAFMPAGGLSGLPYATLFGRPMIETEHCQALATAGDIILASMGEYQTISKGGVQAASSIHVYFLTDDVAFRFIYRIDGSPKHSSTITPVHGSTVSPFVVLKASSS